MHRAGVGSPSSRGGRFSKRAINPGLPGLLPTRLGQHSSLLGATEFRAIELAEPRLDSDALLPALLDALLQYVMRARLDKDWPQNEVSGAWE